MDAGWESAGLLGLSEGHRLGKPEILFSKIEDEVIQKQTQQLAVVPDRKSQIPELKSQIGIDDFKKIDLRVATVLAAEKVPKSEKLLKLKVSLGDSERQIVAGIAQHYKPDGLVGKKIVVVANLQPAKIMGQESQGMLLAASEGNNHLTILTVAEDIGEGSVVK